MLAVTVSTLLTGLDSIKLYCDRLLAIIQTDQEEKQLTIVWYVLNNREIVWQKQCNRLRQSHYLRAMRAHCPLLQMIQYIWLNITIETVCQNLTYFDFDALSHTKLHKKKTIGYFELAASFLLLSAMHNIMKPPAVDFSSFLLTFLLFFSKIWFCTQNQCHKEWRCIVRFCSKLRMNAFMLCVLVHRLKRTSQRDKVYKQFMKMFNI